MTKCSACGNPNAELFLKLIVKNLQTGIEVIKEGCGICIIAEVLAGHNFAKKIDASGVIIVEKMAEKLCERSYNEFKDSMKTKH